VVTGPLAAGYASQAPYDAIVLEGAVETIPDALFAQLRDGGRLVAVVQEGPVGRATLFQSVDGTISSRVAFNVSVRPLPGFQRPPAFAF
jgi:protein-L-isoaspartate(D-aspartate) O-methyltransferase